MTQQINLYDPSLRRRRELVSLANLAIVSLVLLVVVVATGLWARSAADQLEAELARLEPKAKGLQDQLVALGQQVAARKPDTQLEQELADLKLQFSTRGEMLGMLQKGLGPQAISFAEYLRGFARQTPQGLWLTGFSIDAEGAGMQIKGRTTDPALVPEYIRRLNSEKVFQGQAFATLQLGLPEPEPGSKADAPPLYHQFTLAPSQPVDAAAPAGQAAQQKLTPTVAANAVADSGKTAEAGHP